MPRKMVADTASYSTMQRKLTVPRNSNLATRSSKLESFEHSGSSRVHRVLSQAH